MNVAVIMPSIDEKASKISMQDLIKKAGMKADFMVLVDKQRTGFIKTVNNFVKKTYYKYYVYLAQDAYGGKDWLKIAYNTLENTKKSLFAFHDGKWFGEMAAFGMVRRSWKAPFFNEDYKANYADVELTMLAMNDKELVTDLKSILVEVDYNKHGVNLEDKKLFAERKKGGFDNQISNKSILRKWS
ncbi:MAG: hypothetical protein U9O94_07330 [Nanoarchaeota archaeon]|nr:hypothetical protein [Nanoarchaeota archaeon]